MDEGRKAWWAVSAMFAFNGGLFGIWASRVPAVAARHGLEPGTLGLVLLMMAAGAILSFPLAGRGADRFGAFRVTWWMALVYLVAMALLALAPNLAALVGALFLFGVGHGAMDVAMNVWAGEVEKRSGKPIMPSFHAMWSLGAGLGAGSGYIAVKAGVGIAPHFIIAGLIMALPVIGLARIPWRSDLSAPHDGPIFAFPRGPLLAVGAIAMCSAIGEGGMADWSAIFLIREAGTSEAMAALGYASYSVLMVAMRLSGARVIARFGPVASARFAGSSAALGALLVVLMPAFTPAMIGFGLMGIGYALVIPLAFSRAANDPHMPPGAAIASVSTLGYGGILMGPPFLGFVAQASSVRFSYLVLAVLATAVIALAGALRR